MRIKYIISYLSENTPAKAYPKRKEIIINYPVFYEKIKNYNVRIFILLHELAHILKFYGETDADKKATEIYLKRGYPKRDIIFAFSRIINPSKALERIKGIWQYF